LFKKGALPNGIGKPVKGLLRRIEGN